MRYQSLYSAVMGNSKLVYSEQQSTVNSRLADTLLLWTPRYYRQQQNPQRKLQTLDWTKLLLLWTLATTDLRTLYSVLTSQFYCFLSRYSGHRPASWNIWTHIKSIFSRLSLSFLVDFRFLCPSIKFPSSFSPNALLAVSLPWISLSVQSLMILPIVINLSVKIILLYISLERPICWKILGVLCCSSFFFCFLLHTLLPISWIL